jgi:hypothetical protein
VTWHLALLATATLGVIKAAVGGGPSDLSTLGNYGVVGVMLALFIGFSYRLITRETKRADDNAGEVRRLNELIQDKVIPALVDSASALRESAELVRDLTRHPPDSRR